FEALDPRLPATMSRPALDGILRDRLGYEGVVISDDLEMKAIADHFGWEEAVVRGVLAGVDLFLVCHRAEVQHEAIDRPVAAVRSGEVPRAAIEEAGRRVDALLARYARPAAAGPRLDALRCAAHLRVVEEVHRRAGALAAASGRDPTSA